MRSSSGADTSGLVCLVTGATGMVGGAVVMELLGRGYHVRALVRDVAAAASILPHEVERFKGDVTDKQSLISACSGVHFVFHCAGIPEQWRKDPRDFERVNVQGTANVLEAIRHHYPDRLSPGQCRPRNAGRLLYTSTQDVFVQRFGEKYDESQLKDLPDVTPYRESKIRADRLVTEAFAHGEVDAVFLHPSAVYGPRLSSSPTFNFFFENLLNGKIPALLAGSINVVYHVDCAVAHVAAAERAAPGSRYLVSESSHSLEEIARLVMDVGGRRGAGVPWTMPAMVADAVAAMSETVCGVVGGQPAVQRGQVLGLRETGVADCSKLRRELDWTPIGFEEGLARTIDWLMQTEKVPCMIGPGGVKWEFDDASPRCGRCKGEFSVINRRHHCRKCGALVCADCSTRTAPLAFLGTTEPQRLCDKCADDLGTVTAKDGVVIAAVASPDASAAATHTHEQPQQDETEK